MIQENKILEMTGFLFNFVHNQMNKRDLFMKGDVKVCYMDTRSMGISRKWRATCRRNREENVADEEKRRGGFPGYFGPFT